MHVLSKIYDWVCNLDNEGDFSTKEIADNLHISTDCSRDWVRKLHSAGVIEKIKNRPRYYFRSPFWKDKRDIGVILAFLRVSNIRRDADILSEWTEVPRSEVVKRLQRLIGMDLADYTTIYGKRVYCACCTMDWPFEEKNDD